MDWRNCRGAARGSCCARASRVVRALSARRSCRLTRSAALVVRRSGAKCSASPCRRLWVSRTAHTRTRPTAWRLRSACLPRVVCITNYAFCMRATAAPPADSCAATGPLCGACAVCSEAARRRAVSWHILSSLWPLAGGLPTYSARKWSAAGYAVCIGIAAQRLRNANSAYFCEQAARGALDLKRLLQSGGELLPLLPLLRLRPTRAGSTSTPTRSPPFSSG